MRTGIYGGQKKRLTTGPLVSFSHDVILSCDLHMKRNETYNDRILMIRTVHYKGPNAKIIHKKQLRWSSNGGIGGSAYSRKKCNIWRRTGLLFNRSNMIEESIDETGEYFWTFCSGSRGSSCGSIDEEDDEHGIAHMIEHVAFLGSKKRRKLIGTGAPSNAYTNFRNTVFHIYSPTCSKDSGGDRLQPVLDVLNEIVFHPQFLASRVEKERIAILSELQMMNTIEYRVDCQLGKRLPIGLEEQIKKLDADKMRKFHERWYFPANATLYIGGDIDNISKLVYHIELCNWVFGIPVLPASYTAMGLLRIEVGDLLWKEYPRSKHDPLPSLLAVWWRLFRLSEIPVNKLQTYGDMRNFLMKRVFLFALHFRIQTRYQVRRLKEFGVTKGELSRYMGALLKESEQLAAMTDIVSSVDNLELIMENDALGHVVTDHKERHESLVAVTGAVTLEEANSIGAKVLEFVADFGKSFARHPAAIVAFVPKKVHDDERASSAKRIDIVLTAAGTTVAA
ncbi:hypothetical protein RHMOL_Rhmol02G0150900 [Rhododendron molle]|uniref:Uncharacterized protein n=1 Tax=Rhododendron molle TaxID=49168 RepID=A0ACC0PQ04_RHOML|nr:hypothetical protein RHMOL_Rhmol02G0150900 [Rhododendron molle]